MGQHGRLIPYFCPVHGHLVDALEGSVKRVFCERCRKWIDEKDARRDAVEAGEV